LFWFYLLSSLETKAKGETKMISQTTRDSSRIGLAVKKSLKQQPLLEAKSKRDPLATGIPLPFSITSMEALEIYLDRSAYLRNRVSRIIVEGLGNAALSGCQGF
jgi:hypothetical protein